MISSNRVRLVALILIGLLVFLLIISNIFVVQAQENDATPILAAVVIPQAQDTVEPQGTPVATNTPAPTSTPTIGSEVSEQVSESIGNIDGQTVLNLAVSFVVVALLAFFGGRLMLSGVYENVLEQLLRTETTESIPDDAIFLATPTVGESTRAAVATAEAWLAEQVPGEVKVDKMAAAENENQGQSGNSEKEA